MKMRVILVPFFLCLSACQVYEIHNGELPDELIQQAQKLSGNYQGSVWIKSDWKNDHSFSPNLRKNLRAVLEVIDKTPRLKMVDDFAGLGCDSHIGKLTALELSSFITRADFEFDPGKCKNKVLGRKVSLYFPTHGSTHFTIEAYKGRKLSGSSKPGAPMSIHYSLHGNFKKTP